MSLQLFVAAALAAAPPAAPAPDPAAPADAPAPASQAEPAVAAAELPPQDPQAEPPAATAPDCCLLAKMAAVEIEIVDAVSSRRNRSGDRFALRLAEPLVVDGRVVAPAGTPGEGEVVHAAKPGIGGKAGELILAARYLDLDGTRIRLRSLRYGPSQGTDNSGAVGVANVVAAAVLPVASVVGFLVSGGNIDIPAGTRANARVAADTRLPPLQELQGEKGK